MSRGAFKIILLYPNLFVSEDAPATANCGDEKNVFAAWSMALRMLMKGPWELLRIKYRDGRIVY